MQKLLLNLIPSILIANSMITALTFHGLWAPVTTSLHWNLEQWFRGFTGIAFIASIGSSASTFMLLWAVCLSDPQLPASTLSSGKFLILFRICTLLFILGFLTTSISGLLAALSYINMGGMILFCVAFAGIWVLQLYAYYNFGLLNMENFLHYEEHGSFKIVSS